jgi:hypothetical protein
MQGKDFALIGHYGYLALAGGGLVIKDLSNPAEPRELSVMFRGGDVVSLAVEGDYACVVQLPNALHVLYVHDPVRPVLRGTYRGLQFSAESIVAISGANIFVTDGHDQMSILYLFGPNGPEFESTVDSTDRITALAASGSFVYAAAIPGNLYVFDVQTPYVPQVHRVSMYGIVTDGTALTVVDDFLVISNLIGSNARAYDISDPGNPDYIIDVQGWGADMAIAGSTAYEILPGAGLRVLDFSNPLFPRIIGSTDVTIAEIRVGAIGSNVFVLGRSGGLWVFDCAQPARPTLITFDGVFQDRARDACRFGESVIIAEGEGGVRVVDMQNPGMPELSYSIPLAGSAEKVAAENDKAAVLISGFGLRYYDLSAPGNPRVLGQYHMNVDPLFSRIALSSEYICVTGGYEWFTVFDVSDSSRFTRTIHGRLAIQPYEIEVHGSTVFFGYYGEVRSAAIAQQGGSLVWNGYYRTWSGPVISIQYDHDVLCALSDGVIHVVDVWDFVHWFGVAQIILPNSNFQRLNFDYPYCTASSSSEIVVYDLSNIAEPTVVGHTIDSSQSLVATALNPPYVYAASTYWLSALECPSLLGSVPASTPAIPDQNILSVYPNPFNGQTQIRIGLPTQNAVEVHVYDIEGRLLQTLEDRVMSAGLHQLSFQAERYASGTYFVELSLPNHRETKMIQLLR